MQRFEVLVDSDGELEQGIRTADLLLDEHRRLQGMSRCRTTAHIPPARCSSTFAGNRVPMELGGGAIPLTAAGHLSRVRWSLGLGTLHLLPCLREGHRDGKRHATL